MTTKDYLGDGVYVSYNPRTQQYTLTAEDGIRVTDTIYMERDQIAALNRFVIRATGENNSRYENPIPKTER